MTNPDKKPFPLKKLGKGSRDKNPKTAGAPAKAVGAKTKSLNSDEAVPMLKYGPYNNFMTFKDRIKTACIEKYGDLGRLIELEEYWEPPVIDRASEYPDADTDDVAKAALIHAMKDRATLISKMKANRASMYAYVVSKLSKESLDELKRHEHYRDIDEQVDPLLLWKTIKELHMVATSSKVMQVVKRKAREEYQSCKQGTYESLVDFKARFDNRYDAYKDQGNVELTEEDVAMDFLESLDRARYSDFIVETINDIAKGVMQPPKDVNEVYVLANTRLVVKKGNSNFNVGASYATVEASRVQKGKNKNNSNKNKNKNGKLSGSNGAEKTESKGDSGLSKEEKHKKKMENVECFNCGKKGHFARDCTEEEADADDDDDRDRLVGVTQAVGDCMSMRGKNGVIKYYEMILDSGSQLNIVHPRFLTNVRDGAGGCRGLFGDGTRLTKVGMLDGFFNCLSSKDTRVSVLSQADVEDMYEVTYVPGESYTVHMPDRDLKFVRRDKLYVADFSDWISDTYNESNLMLSLMTIEEREHMYTRKEKRRALEAREFIKNAGYPSRNEAIHMVRDGNINNVPVTVNDINNYYDIYGPMVEIVRGKTTGRAARTFDAGVDAGLKEQKKMQVMTSDIMYLLQQTFLVSVASPLELTISCPLSNQGKSCLGQALQVQINLLRSRGFDVTMVIVDPQKSIAALEGSFPGVEVNSTGAGDHLHKVDARIRRVKENARSVLAGLPYTLPKNRVKDLVTYVVNRMNTRRTSALNDNVCPRTRFTGRKIDYKREFMLGFGDYVETYDPKVRSNSMRERTEPCIALYPAANVSGSWIFWNLKTEAYVRRTHWIKMFMPQRVITSMNEHAGIKLVVKAEENVLKQEELQTRSTETVVPRTEPDVPTLTAEEAMIESTDAEAHGGEYDEDVKPEAMVTEEPDPEPPEIRRSDRARVPKRDGNYVYALTQLTVRKGLEKHGANAKEAIRLEFEQLFKKKKVFKPVKRSSLSAIQRKKIIRSSMFLKEKYDGLGNFEKLKGRLVADGRMQDKALYGDKRSPTARIESIMLELSIAVQKRRRMAKADIGGAYLNAFVDKGDEILMELSKELTTILLEVFPELREFVDDDSGRLVVRILKALYGLVQSAALWYEALTRFLKRLGFFANKVDNCVLNMNTGGRDVTIILYVDDILILAEKDEDIHWLIDALKAEYGELTVEMGDQFTYLGMVLTRTDGGRTIELRMDGYIDNVLNSFNEYKNLRKATTPANINLFKPSTGKLLKQKDRARFHTTVARLLYLSKRTRPDIQLPVLYLCTRVKEPNEEDDAKLRKILGYLRLTKKKPRIITSRGNLNRLVAYVDASFAVHHDGRGHTGLAIKRGESTLVTVCRKQKIATKSSTESELVGLSDVLSEIEKSHEYMEEQGVGLDIPLVYQDNMSTIALVSSENSGNVRTRHLNARRSIVHEAWNIIRSIEVQFLPTKQMIADVLTKPLGGNLFYRFADALMGRRRNQNERTAESTVDDSAGATGVRWE